MGCRCGEIWDNNEKINQINEACERLNVYNDTLSELAVQLNRLAGSLRQAVTPKFAIPVGQKMQQIPARFTSAGSGISVKLRSRGEELRSLVEALKEEDEEYHRQERFAREAMERQRKRNHQDCQALEK